LKSFIWVQPSQSIVNRGVEAISMGWLLSTGKEMGWVKKSVPKRKALVVRA
jgi:hypothetical protein